MAAEIEVKYFNTFLLKKNLNSTAYTATPMWNGSRGIPTIIGGFPRSTVTNVYNWVIEESRIQGGYNNTTVDFGVRAYLVEEDPASSIRYNSMIYSGVYNSRTGINNTNQFSVGEDISKSLDPINGSIQKLYAEDTNLIIFQEAKVSRALIDKDAVYSAEGEAMTTSGAAVIGQVQAYAGNYGISRDPRSFAVYGYRKYFTDRDRNSVLRLSQDGITEISSYGMTDYFRDTFNSINSVPYGSGQIIGGWDIYNKQFVVSLQTSFINPDNTYNTLSFDENCNGFTSFFNYNPSQLVSLRNNVYSLNNDSLWIHYSEAVPHNDFYGTSYRSSIKFVFNLTPSSIKSFKTINYEGTNGWQVDSFVSDLTGTDKFNGNFINYQDTTTSVYSYTEGAYDNYGNEYPFTLYPPINYAGFMRQENKYKANLINSSLAQAAEISFGESVNGIKGYFATVTMSTDIGTDIAGYKELYVVSTEYV